jgi:D-3-phosphoglycerate dehydrogenase
MNPKHKILITDELSPQALEMLEQADDVEFDIIKGMDEAQLTETIAAYDAIIIRSSVKITPTVLGNAKKLRVVGRAGVGVDNVALDQASMQGVIVMNTPGANSMATAEHTMALLLALSRHVPQAYSSLKSGAWNRKQYVGTQLYNKTIGLVGLGRIGSRVALRCQGFGMTVLAYDPYLSDEVARELKVKLVDLDELFSKSDFISLHAALTPETDKLINATTLSQMKDGVRLVNCARGGLIDDSALVEALKSGKVAGVALDVFTKEPLAEDSPLRELDNVIFTPHLAASTVEAQRDVGTQVVSQVLGALRGNDLRNAVNMPLTDPQVFQSFGPYLDLAEKVGSLQGQLANKRIDKIEVEFQGKPAEQVKLMTVALLKGLLSPVLEETVNYVNAPYLANRRGLAISHTEGGAEMPNYSNLITCRVFWEGGSRLVAASLFQSDEPRVVKVDSYRVDVRPEGRLLVTDSLDVPGVIGQMGTLLGESGVNIASMRLGRDEPGGRAMSFIRVDEPVPQEVIDKVLSLEHVSRVRQVVLE